MPFDRFGQFSSHNCEFHDTAAAGGLTEREVSEASRCYPGVDDDFNAQTLKNCGRAAPRSGTFMNPRFESLARPPPMPSHLYGPSGSSSE